MNQTHVYICGAKGISQYGGFESFVQKLLEYSEDYKNLKYHVACKANGEGAMNIRLLKGASEVKNNRFTYCGADCFLVKVPSYLGPAQAVFYDVSSIKNICKLIKKNHIEKPIVYILTYRIGPFIKKYVNCIHRYGGKIVLNPDGHEWKRKKWSKWVRKYWKLSELMMVKYADYIVCDNKQMMKYINEKYKKYNPMISFIPYGADITPSKLLDNSYKFLNWLEANGVEQEQYYLVVGRFVEENNFDFIIKEFMKTKTQKKLVILTTVNKKLNNSFSKKLSYKQDERVVFTTPVYDAELLKKIREHAYAYIHGHEVGGTNPSLLEGLASTNVNLVLDVKFNREVADYTAFYWTKKDGCLTRLIEKIDLIDDDKRIKVGKISKERVSKEYDWENIAKTYKKLMLTHCC